MHGRHPNSHPTRRRREVRDEANGRLLALVMVVALVVAGLIVIAGSNDGRAPAVDAPEVEAAARAAEPAALVQPDPGQPDTASDQPDEEADGGHGDPGHQHFGVITHHAGPARIGINP